MRHNAGHNTSRPTRPSGAKGLGIFQRELLLHIAIRTAQAILEGNTEQRADLVKGFRWQPAKAVANEVDYTPTLRKRVSTALWTLEKRGLVTTTGGTPERRRTSHVKLMPLGWKESTALAARGGLPETKWRETRGTRELRREAAATRDRLRHDPSEQPLRDRLRQLRDAIELHETEPLYTLLGKQPTREVEARTLLTYARMSQWLRTFPKDDVVRKRYRLAVLEYFKDS